MVWSQCFKGIKNKGIKDIIILIIIVIIIIRFLEEIYGKWSHMNMHRVSLCRSCEIIYFLKFESDLCGTQAIFLLNSM